MDSHLESSIEPTALSELVARLDTSFNVICLRADMERSELAAFIGCANHSPSEWDDNEDVLITSLKVVTFIEERVTAASQGSVSSHAARDSLLLSVQLLAQLDGDVRSARLVVNSAGGPDVFDRLIAKGKIGTARKAIVKGTIWLTAPGLWTEVRELDPEEAELVQKAYDEAKARWENGETELIGMSE